MDSILIVVIALIGLKLIAELVLNALNLSHVRANAGAIPPAYREVMDDETYQKSVNYTLARGKFGFINDIFDAVVLIVVLVSGLLPFLWVGVTDVVGSGAWGQAIALFVVMIVISLISIPLDWYSQFVLEERFGFNKSTKKLWVVDKIKGLVIGAVIAIPLLALLFWLVRFDYWWLWGFAVFVAFQLLMMVFAPMVIMPLFNKFEPLKEGELKTRLMSLADRTGFKARTILVMDGSKRSAHSNAFFTGFGKARRIVLFDTLMEQLSPEELEAVLAHEIGHYKRGHIPKMLTMSIVFSFLAFFAIGYLAESEAFLSAFGFSTAMGVGPAFLLFSLLAGLVTFWFGPLSNMLSRKHEYEADAFAREAVGTPETLVSALHRMYQKNLGNLTPHPAYSGFYYSHPALHERQAALRA